MATPTNLISRTMHSSPRTWKRYMQQLNGYGKGIGNIVWNIEGRHWPIWIDKSHHQGQFPNNINAAAEFVSLMVQSAKDYTAGHIPHIFEVINEPDWYTNIIDPQTNIDFHKAVANKLKSRFGMKVAGPSYTTMALSEVDENNFAYWKRTVKFLDMSLDHLDFFSFHSYGGIRISGGSHTRLGINEARLVASLDMVESYSHLKKGRAVQLINTEFGRGGVFGVAPEFENGMGLKYNGQERIVAPLALANPQSKEMVVLLHNYGSKWQNVKLDFPNDWINPSTGEETCVLFENGQPIMNSDYSFDRSKIHGTVGLPGSSTCFYKFKTNYNFAGIRTDNQNTHYGKDMVIPISNGHAQTTIHLPSSGYHTSHLRVGASRDKNANAKPRRVVFNGQTLSSSYMLFDAMKIEGKTKWKVWQFMVPESQVKTTNTVSMTFDGNGGHVTSVALVVGKLQ